MSSIWLVLSWLSAVAANTAPPDTLWKLKTADLRRTASEPSNGFRWSRLHDPLLHGTVDKPTSSVVGSILPLDVTPWRGKRIRLSCNVSALEISEPKHPWNGVKCMIHYKSAMQGDQWVNPTIPRGTYPATPREVLHLVAPDATDGELVLGLSESAGEIEIGPVAIVDAGRRNPPGTRRKTTTGPARNPRLRGFMSPPAFRAKDFEDLRGWNANIVRWQLNDWLDPDALSDDPVRYRAWLARKLDETDKALEAASRNGIGLIVDLHHAPGGRSPDGTQNAFLQRRHQREFLDAWDRIARRFRGNPGLAGYGLMNEPVQNTPSPEGLLDWWDLQAEAARRIRAIDPCGTIYASPDANSHPQAFIGLPPLPVTGIVYDMHFYWPRPYVSQGVDRNWKDTIRYPGTWNGIRADKQGMRAYLEPVRRFQLAHGVRIHVGEFSAVRWAPGAARWLSDATSLFEEYGWDWTYHAFRESDGWSLEVEDQPYPFGKGGSRAVPSKHPNARATAIASALRGNRPFVPVGTDCSR